MSTIEIPDNDLNLIRVIEVEAGTQPFLDVTLDESGVSYTTGDIATIVGMGGHASHLTYSGPSGVITVLIIPHAYDVDCFTEEYFYFRGVDAEDAAEADWIAIYDRARELRDAAERAGVLTNAPGDYNDATTIPIMGGGVTPLPDQDAPLHTTQDVAGILGISKRAVSFAAAKIDAGRMVGTQRLYSAWDIERLRKRPAPGRPRAAD